MLKKLSFTFLYLFYAVALIAVLLVIRFPKETVLTRVEQNIEGRLPGYTCDISTIKYVYPFNVLVEGVTLVHRDNSSQLPVSNVLVTLDPKHLLSRFGMSLELLGGTMKTGVVLHSGSNLVEFPTLEVSGINLKDVAFIEQNLSREIDGTLELSGRYTTALADLDKGDFSGNVRIYDFKMELKRPNSAEQRDCFFRTHLFCANKKQAG